MHWPECSTVKIVAGEVMLEKSAKQCWHERIVAISSKACFKCCVKVKAQLSMNSGSRFRAIFDPDSEAKISATADQHVCNLTIATQWFQDD